jgi:hypothetical protein
MIATAGERVAASIGGATVPVMDAWICICRCVGLATAGIVNALAPDCSCRSFQLPSSRTSR